MSSEVSERKKKKHSSSSKKAKLNGSTTKSSRKKSRSIEIEENGNHDEIAQELFVEDKVDTTRTAASAANNESKVPVDEKEVEVEEKDDSLAVLMKQALVSNDPKMLDVCLEQTDSTVINSTIASICEDPDSKFLPLLLDFLINNFSNPKNITNSLKQKQTVQWLNILIFNFSSYLIANHKKEKEAKIKIEPEDEGKTEELATETENTTETKPTEVKTEVNAESKKSKKRKSRHDKNKLKNENQSLVFDSLEKLYENISWRLQSQQKVLTLQGKLNLYKKNLEGKSSNQKSVTEPLVIYKEE